MADYGFYWKNFAAENKRGDWPCGGWYTNADHLVKTMTPGDRVWLFTGGDACNQPEKKAGYLVEVFILKKALRNPGEDRAYPANEFHFFLVAEPAKAWKVDPPLLVDEILRGPERLRDEHIGRLLQSPRTLKDDVLTKLKDALAAHRPALASLILGKEFPAPAVP